MARIRSTHPEQWTDEQFVQCSSFARLLALGLRNYADDNGIFEWKPVTIKMRILSADNLEIAPLLEELCSSQQVYRYQYNSKEYGIIRNFTKFQKPKSPSFLHPAPEQLPNGYELHKDYISNNSAHLPNSYVIGSESPPKLTRSLERRVEKGNSSEDNKYEFCGQTIRLDSKHYNRLKTEYSAIPDFDAELKAADSHYTGNTSKDWFFALPGWLNNSHQKHLSKQTLQKPRMANVGSL